MSIQRVCERGEFPPPKVPGEEQHSLAPRDRALKIFEAVVHHDFFNILACIFWEKTNFRQLSSERGKHTPQDASAFPAAHLRIGERKIFWIIFVVLGLLADVVLPIWWALAATIPIAVVSWWIAYRSDWF